MAIRTHLDPRLELDSGEWEDLMGLFDHPRTKLTREDAERLIKQVEEFGGTVCHRPEPEDEQSTFNPDGYTHDGKTDPTDEADNLG